MDKCPKCGHELTYDEVDIGVGVIRGNPGCPDCFWTPEEVAATDRCTYGPLGLHTWSMADGTQCEHCLKFLKQLEEEIDYGRSH